MPREYCLCQYSDTKAEAQMLGREFNFHCILGSKLPVFLLFGWLCYITCRLRICSGNFLSAINLAYQWFKAMDTICLSGHFVPDSTLVFFGIMTIRTRKFYIFIIKKLRNCDVGGFFTFRTAHERLMHKISLNGSPVYLSGC